MNNDHLGVVLTFLAILFLTILIVSVGSAKVLLYGDWQCTQERVVKDTLPKEYECTQWTKASGGL